MHNKNPIQFSDNWRGFLIHLLKKLVASIRQMSLTYEEYKANHASVLSSRSFKRSWPDNHRTYTDINLRTNMVS